MCEQIFLAKNEHLYKKIEDIFLEIGFSVVAFPRIRLVKIRRPN